MLFPDGGGGTNDFCDGSTGNSDVAAANFESVANISKAEITSRNHRFTIRKHVKRWQLL